MEPSNGTSSASSYVFKKLRVTPARIVFYIATLAVLFVIHLKLDELKLAKTFFTSANPYWIVGIIVTQWLSYHFWSLNYRELLLVKGRTVPSHELFPMVIVVQFINQALPSANISGQAFFIYYMRRYGMAVTEGIGRAILEMATLYMAFGVFFIVAIITMAEQGMFHRHPRLLILVGAFAAIAVLFISIFLTLQRKRESKPLEWITEKLHLLFEKTGFDRIVSHERLDRHSGHVSLVVSQFKANLNIPELRRGGRHFLYAWLWQGMYLFMNVLTFYIAARALGLQIPFAAAFVTFTLTKFVSMLAFIPGGIGIFEVLMTLILVAYGFSAGSALGVTLLARIFTFWLPLPIGWWLYNRLTKNWNQNGATSAPEVLHS